jgi:hypothetical protein
MDTDQNWYRQLLALVLLSGARAAVEFITNPGAREDAGTQLKGAFASIDYDALARALTNSIDTLAESSKGAVSGTIDNLRDSGVAAVGQAKDRAQKQLGAPKKKGKKMRFFFGLLIGATLAYFILDEQRRDDLLDRLTGASGPIQQTASNVTQQATSTVQQAASAAQQAAEKAAEKATGSGESGSAPGSK